MFGRVAARVFRNAVSLVAVPVVFVLLVVAGCGTGQNFGSYVAVWHPVWMSDGWVYYLREVDSEGIELWRQREDQEEIERFLLIKDIPNDCGAFSFLFRATGDDLGIATACADSTRINGVRTELMAYSLQRKEFSHIASTPFLGGMAFNVSTATGYVELPTGCGIAIKPIRNGVVEEFTKPITVAGKSWLLSGAQKPDCGSVARARSPVLAPDGTVFFLTAPDSIGKLPITESGILNEFEWYLCSWDGRSDAPRVVTTLRGLADLAFSSDGRFIIAAVSTEGGGGILRIDPATGKTEEIVQDRRAYHPSLSPDNNRLVYVKNLQHIRFASLPGAIS